MSHEFIEKNVGLMAVLIVLVIVIGGLVEIVPLMFQAQTIEPAPGIKPYSPLRLAGATSTCARDATAATRR